MNTRNDSLWDRIETQPIGPQSSVLGFERRLARDNGWSEAFAARVIHEYRRFLFLAARAGHPVTPSDAVDQAWHLHLIYSDDYWNTWCQEVLGFPFHHGPTRGGRTEQTKYTDWYSRTLASYQDWFGTPPPSDIWPAVEDRFAGAAAFRRVNTGEVWIIPKPTTRTLAQWSAAAMAAVGLTGCGALAVTDWNVLDWTGTPFLILYLCLMAAALAVLLVSRWQRGTPDTSADTRLEAEDPYVVAGLVDGARGILQAGLAGLAARGLIESHPATPAWIGRRKGAQPGNLNPVEEAIWEAIPTDREIETRKLRKELKPLFASVRSRVQQRGWEPSPATLGTARLWRAGIVLSLVVLGAVKIAVGYYRDRPVGFLVVLTLATLLFGLILAFRIPRRTRAGQTKVQELHAQEAELRQSLRQPNLDPDWSVPMMVALFGAPSLPERPSPPGKPSSPAPSHAPPPTPPTPAAAAPVPGPIPPAPPAAAAAAMVVVTAAATAAADAEAVEAAEEGETEGHSGIAARKCIIHRGRPRVRPPAPNRTASHSTLRSRHCPRVKRGGNVLVAFPSPFSRRRGRRHPVPVLKRGRCRNAPPTKACPEKRSPPGGREAYQTWCAHSGRRG